MQLLPSISLAVYSWILLMTLNIAEGLAVNLTGLDLANQTAEGSPNRIRFFRDFVGIGLTIVQRSYPLAQIFRVTIQPEIEGTITKTESFHKIVLELDDRRGRMIIIETRPPPFTFSWMNPYRGPSGRMNSYSRFLWDDLTVDLDDALRKVAEVGRPPGPYNEIEVLKYTSDHIFAGGQIYYTFVNRRYQNWVEFGTTTRKVYPHQVMNHVEVW